MNTDTGQIENLTEAQWLRATQSGKRLVEIDEALMTPKQRANLSVSLQDTASALGKQLHAARSKYLPHIGKKQLAKAAK